MYKLFSTTVKKPDDNDLSDELKEGTQKDQNSRGHERLLGPYGMFTLFGLTIELGDKNFRDRLFLFL